MIRRDLGHRVSTSVMFVLCVAIAVLLASQQPGTQQSSIPVGATQTQLADGRVLVLGGSGRTGALATVEIFDPASGTTVTLPGGMIEARSHHTATMLADGTVLIVGGTDRAGTPLATAERFDPTIETFSPVPLSSRTPRATHSATLLTDGRVLVLGGDGDPRRGSTAELWDVAASAVTAVPGLRLHTDIQSALLPDGRVLIGDAVDSSRQSRSLEVFDPSSERITPMAQAPEPDAGPVTLMESRPGADAHAVPVDTIVALRFSDELAPRTITSQSVELTGPSGVVGVRIVVAEHGRLVFVHPSQSLEYDATYTLAMRGATNSTGEAVLVDPLVFETAKPPAGADRDPDIWTPDAQSGWRTNNPESWWQRLKPLQAPPGVTALAGQTLRIDGEPLVGVTVEIDGHRAQSDGTGRFLLRLDDFDGEHEELWVDGRTAKRTTATYGTYEIGVDLKQGTTRVLPFTIWMTALDTAHAVAIPSPTAGEVSVATPLIPGLELRLPAGTTIRDHDGKVVTSLTITPVPLDRPPFPLPAGVEVPVYFTIQPGGAYIYVSGTTGKRGGRLIYPNGLRLRPRTTVDFWHYEADGPGWYVYGLGQVTPDGQQIVPNPGVEVYELTGAMVAGPGLAPGTGPRVGDPDGSDGDPVDLSTGLFVLRKTDVALPGPIPIELTRTYRPGDSRSRAFGIGASHPYDAFLVGTTFPYTYLDLILADGAHLHFDRTDTNDGNDYAHAVFQHTSTPTRFYKSRIEWNGNGWTLTMLDGTTWTFREGFGASAPWQSGLLSVRDRYGNALTVTRDAAAKVSRVDTSNGRFLTFAYDPSARVTSVQDNIGRSVTYTYDASGRLWKVTDPENGVTEYTYDNLHRMLTLKDARGIVFLTNQYDTNDRVILQTLPGSLTYQFVYTIDGQGRIVQTDVTNPRSFVRRVTFNSSGYATSVTDATSTSTQRRRTIERQSGGNFVTAQTDALERRTELTYDASGRVLTVTRLAGTADAAMFKYSYEPMFGQIASISDPLGHMWSATYDSGGKLNGIANSLGHLTTVAANSAGQLTSITDPLQHTWQISYTVGDVASITDPLNRTWTQFVDSAGRVVATVDPAGNRTQRFVNRLNRATAVMDAMGAQTGFVYDSNSNVTSVVDALNHGTTFGYDDLDRVSTRTDALMQSETYAYDGNDNSTQHIDRKGQITTAQYDQLDRPSNLTFQDGSTITYTYDGGDRIIQVADSANGNIIRDYDPFDRLTLETTPQGSVSYSYDADGRRTSMTVAGQQTVTYTYDAADRLMSVTQGSDVATFVYDSSGRRTALTYPNGIVATLVYDSANQLLESAYSLGSVSLGNLTYYYDALGRRTASGGTLARTGLPPVLSGASYDTNNQLASWDGVPVSYDQNGNVSNDGAFTYGWNARNQLTTMSGPVSANFLYDSVGRRRGTTVGSATTAYLYDQANLVQELSGGGTPVASILSGFGFDEVLQRTEAGGSVALLTDALGSVTDLADQSGVLQTHYTFEPFGATTTSGSPAANGQQFTARESDGTGLYFYRARYYNPRMQRFISEDPVGFAGGSVNLHSYVGNGPTQYKDPTGRVSVGLSFGGLIGIGFGVTGSVTVTIVSNGDVGVQITGGVDAIAGGSLSGTVGPQVTNAQSLGDLAGPFGEVGGSIGAGAVGGVDVFAGRGRSGPVYGGSVGVGVGGNLPVPYPGEMHGGVTDTVTWGCNIFTWRCGRNGDDGSSDENGGMGGRK